MRVIESKWLEMQTHRKEIVEKTSRNIEKYDKKVVSYEIEPWEQEIVEQVSKTHPQLSPLYIMATVIVTMKKLGLIFVMPMGGGKSSVIRSFRDLFENDNMICVDSGFSPADLYLKLKENPEYVKKFENGIVLADDMSTFLSSADKTMWATFTMLSQLIEAMRYEGHIRMHPTIERAKIAMLAAATPKCLKDIVTMGAWASHVQDRFMRLYVTYYNIKKDSLVPTTYTHPKIDLDIEKIKGYDESKIGWDVDNELLFECVNLLRAEFSERRSINYAKRLLKAHAYLSDRSEATNKDARWLLLYKPLIYPEMSFLLQPRALTYGIITSGPLTFADIYLLVIHYCGYCWKSKEELKKDTKLDTQTLELILRQLKESGYIVEENNKYFVGGSFGEELKQLYSVFH